MSQRVTVSFSGVLPAQIGGQPFDARFSYDPARAPDSVAGNAARYDLADPAAAVEIAGTPLPAPEITLTVTDTLDVNGAGILFVDSLAIEMTGGAGAAAWRYEVEPITLQLDSLTGTALPTGPFDFETFGESTLVNRLLAPEIAPGFVDLPLRDFALGQGAEGFRVTTSEARLVARLFEIGLDRDGDLRPEGINHWIDAREGGLSEEQLAFAFLRSDEFADSFGAPETLSDRALVERLFLNGLDRPGRSDGIDHWTAALADPDFSRGDLLIAFADSLEKRDALDLVESLVEVAPGVWDVVG